MTAYEGEEVTREFLARLPRATSDPARAQRTRRQCRALLGRQHQRRERSGTRIALASRILRPVTVGVFCSFCVVYVSSLVSTVWRLQAPSG